VFITFVNANYERRLTVCHALTEIRQIDLIIDINFTMFKQKSLFFFGMLIRFSRMLI